jgi:hypothetical protein
MGLNMNEYELRLRAFLEGLGMRNIDALMVARPCELEAIGKEITGTIRELRESLEKWI